MRAVAIQTYGGPEVLQLQDLPEPKVGPDSVLVRVAAASINPVDYKIVQGYLDGAFPVVWPLVPGWDVAGEVVGVGPAVRDLRRLSRDADVVHAHGLRAGALCCLATTGRRTPVVLTLHNAAPAGRLTGAVHAVLERVVARRAALVLGVSADLVDA